MAAAVRGGSVTSRGLSELKRRIAFLLLGILIYRIGSHVPVPGLDPLKLSELFTRQQSGILGLFNMFSGGALQRLTIFALGVMPYISSSIIVQLMTVVIPAFETLKKDGANGRRKLSQYTRLGALALAILQSLGIAKWLSSAGIVLVPGAQFYIIAAITLTAGSMFLMWLGEQMTEYGVGNGISMLIFVGIVSRFPTAVAQVLTKARQGQMQVLSVLILLVLVLLITGAVIFFEQGQRKIVVSYARRQERRGGAFGYAGGGVVTPSSSLPLKINLAGVIPPIFASSIILFPAAIFQWLGNAKGVGIMTKLGNALAMGKPLYMILYTVAIIFFCYFYTALMFNPKEIADNLKKTGAFLPGIRPGEHTANYLDEVITRLTLFGAIYITIISLLPDILMFVWHMPFYFGGTSLLIVVVVLMEFIGQIKSYLMSARYDKIMKKTKFSVR